VVSSWIGSQVQVWDPQARKVVEKHTNLAAPLDAIRYYGDLVVSELSTHSVIRLNSTGRATLTSSLVVPAGLAASQGDLWVADWATGMVWQIMAAGAPVQIPVAKGLAGPEGLAVDQDGSLLVVESRAGRLARIDRKTGEVTTMAEGLELGASGAPNWPPTWAFNGVAVGTSGAIYVTGDKANVLYRLRGVN
jgi:sugar lactone lactonase YvrE